MKFFILAKYIYKKIGTYKKKSTINIFGQLSFAFLIFSIDDMR